MGKMTIKDIARACGVGVSTVSRAMNNHPDINPETRARIMEEIAKANYIPNNSARNLKCIGTKSIAVLVKGIGNGFLGDLVGGLERECKKREYSFLLQYVEEQEDEVDAAIRIAKEKKPSGMVFLGGDFSHPEQKMEQLDIPFVLSTIEAPEDKEGKYASVSVDDFMESYKMTEYLLNLGHDRIGVITAPRDDKSIGRQRLLGYRKALMDKGVPYREELVKYMDAEEDRYSLKSGYKLTGELLRETSFSAIYAVSDSLAMGACRALKEAGISIPKDCSVAGFDGTEEAEFYIPKITTIRQPVESIAKATADILFDMIINKKAPQKVVFPGELLKRESTDICH